MTTDFIIGDLVMIQRNDDIINGKIGTVCYVDSTLIGIDLGVKIHGYTHYCGGILSGGTGRYFARRCLVKMNTPEDVGDLEDDY